MSGLRTFVIACVGLSLCSVGTLFADQQPSASGVWDTYSDTWVATDALGRRVPLNDEVGNPRADRTVGIFYFLWHGAHVNGGPYDVTKILAQDPEAMQKKDSPLWGPLYAPHHWGESIWGYYLTDDAGVLRKHAQMLSDAGVDTVIFDVTNQITYKPYYMALLRVFSEVRRDGGKTPQVAFLCPFWEPSKVVPELYHDLYEPGLYRELWFQWDGKPLILADPEKLGRAETSGKHDHPAEGEKDAEIRRFFTFRSPQPDYFRGPTKPDMWSWLEVYPQHVFRNARGEKEQMSVGVAQNAVDNRLATMSEKGARGRSFQEGVSTPPPGAILRGLNVAQQWDRALKEDPRFVFITGWNEWIAGRFDEFAGVRMPVMFVDQFDQEHSRDIEPMKGGHGDNYYYQMVSYIRRYKGARPLPPVVSRSIAIDGRFDDWADVAPEFRDTIGDPVRRDHPGWGSAGRYVDASGRNDLVTMKVSADAEQVYFYVRTREPLTPRTDADWMVLLLDVDCNASTGWLGYDYAVNRAPAGEKTVILQRHAEANTWASPVEVPYRTAGNELELAIPLKALGLASVPEAIDFKWTDNVPASGEAVDFTLHGDAAPNDQFNYRARFEGKR